MLKNYYYALGNTVTVTNNPVAIEFLKKKGACRITKSDWKKAPEEQRVFLFTYCSQDDGHWEILIIPHRDTNWTVENFEPSAIAATASQQYLNNIKVF